VCGGESLTDEFTSRLAKRAGSERALVALPDRTSTPVLFRTLAGADAAAATAAAAVLLANAERAAAGEGVGRTPSGALLRFDDLADALACTVAASPFFCLASSVLRFARCAAMMAAADAVLCRARRARSTSS